MDSGSSKPTPVRPAILSERSEGLDAPALQSVAANTPLAPSSIDLIPISNDASRDSAVEPSTATSPTAAPLADAATPCPNCGYDLRGTSGRMRCPECGTVVVAKPAPMFGVAGELERFSLRDELSRAWHALGFLALAPIALLSPLPCLLPFGIGLAICFGFAPAFRLMAVRAFARLPDEHRLALNPSVRFFRRTQILELCFVAAITVYAAVATFGLTTRSIVPVYYALIFGWWCSAAIGLHAQLNLGQRVILRAAAVTGQPTAPIAFVLRGILACVVVALAAAALLTSAAALPSSVSSFVKASSMLGTLTLVVVSIVFAACAIFARTHAALVAESLFVAGFLSEARPLDAHSRVGARVEAEPSLSRRVAATRADDDAPIPLADAASSTERLLGQVDRPSER